MHLHTSALGVAVFKDVQRTGESGQLEHLPCVTSLLKALTTLPSIFSPTLQGTIEGFERKGTVLGPQLGAVHTL